MKKWTALSLLLCYSLVGSVYALTGDRPMILTSTAFSPNGTIPMAYTCEGTEVSPPLAWSNVPSSAKSLVLIVEDPDAPDPKAPKVTWVHWVLYNLPANSTGLPEHVSPAQLPAGTLVGMNSHHQAQYQGPCPPIGKHRYFFKLYALDSVLPDLHEPNAAILRAAMEGKIVAETELMGTYIKLD